MYDPKRLVILLEKLNHATRTITQAEITLGEAQQAQAAAYVEIEELYAATQTEEEEPPDEEIDTGQDKPSNEEPSTVQEEGENGNNNPFL